MSSPPLCIQPALSSNHYQQGVKLQLKWEYTSLQMQMSTYAGAGTVNMIYSLSPNGCMPADRIMDP